MASTKQPLPPIVTNLVMWVGVPLALGLVGRYIIGPRLAVSTRHLLALEGHHAEATASEPTESAPKPTVQQPRTQQSVSTHPATSVQPTLPHSMPSRSATAPTASQTQPIAPATDTLPQPSTGSDPEVTISVTPVRPANHASRHKRKRHHTSVPKPQVPAPAKPEADDGSFGGTEEGSPIKPS